MDIKPLHTLSKEQLYASFREAFADYEVQLTQEELFRMLKRRGFQPDLSFGAFYEDRLVSFTFNGIGMFTDLRTAYDTGTGTLPDFRGKGLAGAVFSHTEKELKSAGIQQYLLEVLQHNTTAVKLYRKLGFEITREFNYFNQDARKVKLRPDMRQTGEEKSIALSEAEGHGYEEFHASWQNSDDSIQRSPEDFKALGFYADEQLLGFLVTDPQTGDIAQMLVHPGHRRKGIGTALVSVALQINQHKEIKLVNADTRDTGMIKFMESLGIPLQGKQYEMIKKF